jgi:hypothetical protein
MRIPLPTAAAFAVFLIAGLAALAAPAAASSTDKADPGQGEIDQIIARFASKEAEFAKARESYTYRQTVRVQELEPGGTPTGKYEIVSDIIFSPEGKRTERIVRAPMSTLHNISLTPEDEQDLRNVQPFVLTTGDIDKYYVRYLGREKLDEIPCYAFAVKPKTMEKGQRYFSGTIWVDDQDLQIVKTYGRGVGLTRKGFDNQFPKFETYREQIDKKYWFPTYTTANDTLYFQMGPQRIKMMVRYDDYKRFEGSAVIKYGDEVKEEPKKPEPPKK